MLKSMIIAAALLASAPALAQNAAKPATLSAEAQATVKEHMSKRNAEMAPLLAKKRDLQKQFDTLLAAQSFDEAKLAATMAQMREVEGQLFDKMGGSMLALMKALPDQDRVLFMKSLTKTPPAGPGR